MPKFLNFGIMNYCHLTEVSVRFSHYVAIKEMYHQNVEMKHYLRIAFVNGHFNYLLRLSQLDFHCLIMCFFYIMFSHPLRT